MRIKQIESSSNELYKKLLSLTKSKGVTEHGQCLVSGEKVVTEIATLNIKDAFYIYHSDDHDFFNSTTVEQLIVLPKKLFSDLDVVGTNSPLLCVNTPNVNKWDSKSPLKNHELLCALGDPNNLGALLRSARAFGITNIVLLEECCRPFHPKVIKASAGACFHLNFFNGPSIQSLSDIENILALDGSGKKMGEIPLNGMYRILLGEEGQGVPQNINALKVAVPIDSSVESLNATVAASILFYEISNARRI